MANIFLAWQNRADEGTLSGGSWSSSLPLNNMLNRQVQKVARSANATTAATQFSLDLGSAKSVGVIALVVHNLSTTAKTRITASNDAAAYSNLLAGENDVDNVAWFKSGINWSTNVTTAPDGTATADLLYDDTFAGSHFISQSMGTQSGVMFVEAWVKAAGRNRGRVQISSTGGAARIDFDLSTGTITSSLGSATMTSGGNGWYKVRASATFTSASMTASVSLLDDNGNSTYTGNGTSGFYVWGIRSNTGEGLLADSGWADAWPQGVIPTELLEWEDDNFWLGTLSENARAGYQSPFIFKLPMQTVARYWKVEIFDTTNADGYVQIGRLFMASGWTPSVNYKYGAGLGYQDPTPVETSLSGAEYFDIRSKYRVFQFELDYITESDAYNYALQLQRLAGTSGEVLVMPDGGENLAQQPLRSFVGRLNQVGAVKQVEPSSYSVTFEVKELL